MYLSPYSSHSGISQQTIQLKWQPNSKLAHLLYRLLERMDWTTFLFLSKSSSLLLSASFLQETSCFLTSLAFLWFAWASETNRFFATPRTGLYSLPLDSSNEYSFINLYLSLPSSHGQSSLWPSSSVHDRKRLTLFPHLLELLYSLDIKIYSKSYLKQPTQHQEL